MEGRRPPKGEKKQVLVAFSKRNGSERKGAGHRKRRKSGFGCFFEEERAGTEGRRPPKEEKKRVLVAFSKKNGPEKKTEPVKNEVSFFTGSFYACISGKRLIHRVF
jgi:hypothetical protein